MLQVLIKRPHDLFARLMSEVSGIPFFRPYVVWHKDNILLDELNNHNQGQNKNQVVHVVNRQKLVGSVFTT